ncbi:hypothetical protein pb186bvf_014310 [Paramecium bursaria]
MIQRLHIRLVLIQDLFSQYLLLICPNDVITDLDINEHRSLLINDRNLYVQKIEFFSHIETMQLIDQKQTINAKQQSILWKNQMTKTKAIVEVKTNNQSNWYVKSLAIIDTILQADYDHQIKKIKGLMATQMLYLNQQVLRMNYNYKTKKQRMLNDSQIKSVPQYHKKQSMIEWHFKIQNIQLK